MFNFIKKSSLIFIVFLSSFAVNANLILGSTDYVTISHGYNEDGTENLIDWAWASSVSVQYDGEFEYDGSGNLIFDSSGNPIPVTPGGTYNELFEPGHIEGWRTAESDEFSFFLSDVKIDSFIDKEGNYIVATSFWNSLYKDATRVSEDAFTSNYRTNLWVEGSVFDWSNLPVDYESDTSYYDTFYVRNHVDPQPVPEPSTLLIFAMGLIALVSKQRLFK